MLNLSKHHFLRFLQILHPTPEISYLSFCFQNMNLWFEFSKLDIDNQQNTNKSAHQFHFLRFLQILHPTPEISLMSFCFQNMNLWFEFSKSDIDNQQNTNKSAHQISFPTFPTNPTSYTGNIIFFVLLSKYLFIESIQQFNY